MSDNEVKKEKVATKYDRKMQRRQEEKKKEERNKKIGKVVGVVLIIALVALIAYFPIRSYVASHETYVTINGENITEVEFDYNYNTVAANYINQNGSFLSYFGLDVTQDFSTQMYSDTMSWKDYFDEMTVESMKQNKALKAEADAAGYEYDAAKEIKSFTSSVKEAAKNAKVSARKYVKQVYGQYASIGNISKYVAENARVNAYYQELSEGMRPSDEEIETYYQENKENYDSVDYYMSTFSAEIDSEATEEEIAAAMETASAEAEAARENLAQEGEEQTNIKKSDAESVTSEWLFDEARKEGDTVVLEDTDDNMYYALRFIRRYLDDTLTADVRVIMTKETDGQAILNEWAAGEATEDSFAQLYDKYSENTGASTKGGLIQNISKDSISAEIADWIFEDGRAAGDTGFVTTEGGYVYVMYYVGQGQPEWKSSISDTLLSETRTEYVDALVENVSVEDAKGNLNYLKVRAEEEAAAAVSGGDAVSAGDAVSTGDAVSGGDAVSDGDVVSAGDAENGQAQ